MKRFCIIITLLVVLAACSTEDITSERQVGQQIPVDTTVVKEVDLEQKLELSGHALPNSAVPLFTLTPLQVIAVDKKVGDSVKAGERILKLDDELVRKQAEQAQKAVAELEEGISAARKLQGRSENDLAELTRLQRELEESLNRSRELISELNGEANDISLLQIIAQTLETSLKQSELTQAAGKLANLPQFNLAELEMQLELAKQNASQVQAAVNATAITSPIDGVIAELNVTKSQLAPPNIALATVVNLQPMIASFHVNSFQVVQLIEGMGATLVVDGIAQQIESAIDVVSPTVQAQTNLFKVEIPLENHDERIKGGMRVTAYIDLGNIKKANVIPISSVLYDEDTSYVFVASDGIAQRKNVTLGTRSGDLVQVYDGITKEDMIVTRGKERLTDGAEIIVRNED